MFSFLEAPSRARLFGGDESAARPVPARAGRAASAPVPAPGAKGEGDLAQAPQLADLSALFAGLVEEVSPEVAEIAAPEQRERFQELAAAGPVAAQQQCSDSQAVDDAIAKSKDAGESRADQILAGARADDDKVHFDGTGFLTGRGRLKDIMRDTVGVEIDDAALNHGDGKIHPGGAKAGSWCGIWAADIWRRAGVPVRWDAAKGTIVDEETGDAVQQESVNAKQQADLAKVEPGDIITIQTLPAGKLEPVPADKQGSVPRNLNHHAIVESRVYEGAGGERVTVPPGEPPEAGRIIGFNIREGNMPQLQDPDPSTKGDEYYNSVHGRFIPAAPTTSTDAVGNRYQTGITTRFALPPEKVDPPPASSDGGGGGGGEWEEDPHRPGRWRPVTPEEITHDPMG